ncbi:hypothetical protein ES703_55425 [subsurface metagenome]
MEVKRDEVTQATGKASLLAVCSLTNRAKADLLRGLYWDMQFSTLDIAELFDMKHSTVTYYIKKYGIPTRLRGEALSLAFKKGKIKRHYQRGKDHFNWRGGRTVSSEGYVWVMRPDHPRANTYGYVREHILIWEETHGRPLPQGWIVHHLNGIPADNRPGNLVAFPDRKHKHLLRAKASRITQLETTLRQAQREMESLRGAMLSGQLTFNLDGHDDSGGL